MTQSWESQSEELAERLGNELHARLTRTRLTAKMLEFRLKPQSEQGSEIRLILSPDESILAAGAGARFEWDALPDSESQLVSVARAIAHGGLSETIWARRVDFTLTLDDGEVLRGRTRLAPLPWRGPSRHVVYPPFVSGGNP